MSKQAKKYICNACQETFDILKTTRSSKLHCPRCSSTAVSDLIACNLEVGPPPWEFLCLECKIRFSVKSPSGPDEAKRIRCPVCESKKVKWIAITCESCPPGG